MDEKSFTRRRAYQRYPLAIKSAIVQEYTTTDCSLSYLRRKYGISTVTLVKHWITSYDKKAYLSRDKVSKNMTTETPGETLEVQRLKQRIHQLERELEDAKLLSEAYALMIKKAEEDLKVPIRKKFNTK